MKIKTGIFIIVLAIISSASATLHRSSIGAEGVEYEEIADVPTCKDYVQDGLVFCLDAIENVAMGVSDHTVPYVFNIAQGDVYFRLGPVTFDEGTTSYSMPQKYHAPLTNDILSAPFRNLNATVEYYAAYEAPGYVNAWGCGVNPTTNGFSFVFISQRWNRLDVSQTGSFSVDSISPTDISHSSIVIFGKTMYSYCQGVFDKQKDFVSEGYQYCNQFGFSTIPKYSNRAVEGMRCFRLYNRALSEGEIKHNYLIDLARFGEEEGE